MNTNSNEPTGEELKSGSETAVEIPFPVTRQPIYKPYGAVMVLDYVPVDKVGVIHMPAGAKQPLEFITVKVLAHGPKVELAVTGTTVLIAVKAIMSVKHDGHQIYVTQENTILGIVEL